MIEVYETSIDGIVNRIIDHEPAYPHRHRNAQFGVCPCHGTLDSDEGVENDYREPKDINLIGADIVEAAPAYVTNTELTTIATVDFLFEALCLRGHESEPPDDIATWVRRDLRRASRIIWVSREKTKQHWP